MGIYRAGQRGNPMRVAIVGSRDYPKLDAVRQFVWEQERDTVIISGGARGVDTAAVDEAKRLGMAYEVYLPDWGKRGRGAGIIRNREIVAKADEVVAFWDGKSRGTQSTIEMARTAGKPVRVFLLEPSLSVAAVDPHASDQGKPPTRAAESSLTFQTSRTQEP